MHLHSLLREILQGCRIVPFQQCLLLCVFIKPPHTLIHFNSLSMFPLKFGDTEYPHSTFLDALIWGEQVEHARIRSPSCSVDFRKRLPSQSSLFCSAVYRVSYFHRLSGIDCTYFYFFPRSCSSFSKSNDDLLDFFKRLIISQMCRGRRGIGCGHFPLTFTVFRPDSPGIQILPSTRTFPPTSSWPTPL
jgi:hypothetical protein